MRKSALLVWLSLSLSVSCFGWEVESRAGGVEILTAPLVDEAGERYGFDLYASNRNEHAVFVTIALASAENIVNGLRVGPIRLATFDQLYLGWIVQDNPDGEWSASYRWTVSAPESRTVESYYWYWY